MARRDYYDIDDIIAGQERVPCVLRVDLDGLGSNNSGSTKVHKNSRHVVPYWIADRMNEEDYMDMEIPPVFSKRAIRMYAASATSTQLRAICPYYYKFGLQLGDMVPDIPDVLRSMYMERIEMVARIAAQQGNNVERLRFVQSLDKTEANMLAVCQGVEADTTEWRQGRAHLLRKAPVIEQ